jgi:RHS repeat-associated protein
MVSAAVSSVTTTFAYRGDGLRNSKTTGGNTTTFTWDVASGLPVVLDDGNQYLYGAGLVAQKQSGSWYYYLTDGLGSTMKTVDASGNVVNAYEYDIYGAKTSSSGGQANEFDFAGQETDGSTGLQYLRARYYDPATGTFASREPLASMPKWTDGKFGYAGASPTNNVDPTGLYWGESKVNKAVAFTKKWVAPALGECAAWGASSALAGVALGGTPTGVVIGAAAGCLAGAINSILDTAGVNNSFLTCATWFASGFAQPAKFLLLRGISGAADCAAALLNREYPSKSGASECTEWGAAGLAVGVVTRGAGAAERAVAAFAGCAGGYMGGQVNALASSR